MAKAETVSCPCGATIEVELDGEASLDAVCPDCGMMLEVMVSVDPRTKVRRVGILVKSASVAPRQRSKPKTPGGKTEEVHTAKCICGAQLTIIPGGAGAIYTCAACEAEYTASFKPGKTGAMLVVRPVLAMPVAGKPAPAAPKAAPAKVPAKPAAPAPKPPPAAAAPPAAKAPAKPAPAPAAPAPAAKPAAKAAPAAPPPVPAGAAAKENQLLMTKADLGAQEVEGEGSNQKVACFCGEPLLLKGEFHREIHKCVPCGRSFRIFAAVNPKTGGTMAVMIAREAGK